MKSRYRKGCSPTWLFLFQSRHPVFHDRDWRRVGNHRISGDEKPLAVCTKVPAGGQSGGIGAAKDESVKEWFGDTRLKRRARCTHLYRHQLRSWRKVQNLSAVPPPARLHTAAI